MTKINKFFAIVFITFICLLLFEIVLRFKGIGPNNIIYYSSNYYGYYQVPNQKINRRGNSITLDSFGNRNPKTNTFENASLIFLGDSITYGGSVVNDNEIFSNLVANKMNVEHLNISSNGWGIPNMINFIDFHNLYKENSTYILTCINDCYFRNLRKIEQNFFASKKDQLGISFLIRYFIFNILKNSYSIDKQPISEKFDNLKTADKSVNSLSIFKKKLTDLNSRLIIIHSPNKERMKDLILDKNLHEKYSRETILNILSRYNLQLFEITDYFDDKQVENFAHFFVDSVHLSKQGHKIYADIIFKLINEN